jgi:hypothetical protein
MTLDMRLWLIGRRLLQIVVGVGAVAATLIVWLFLFAFAWHGFYETWYDRTLPPGVEQPSFLFTPDDYEAWYRVYPAPEWLEPTSKVFGIVAATLNIGAFWMFIVNAHLLMDWLEWRFRRTWRFVLFIREMYLVWDRLEPDPYGDV